MKKVIMDTHREMIDQSSDAGKKLEAMYQKNVSALEKSFPDASLVMDGWDSGKVALWRDDSFRYGMVIENDKNVLSFPQMTDFDSIQKRQNRFIEVLSFGYDSVFLLSVGIGEYLLTLVELLTQNPNETIPEIWMIEPEPQWLEAALCFLDVHELWKHPQIHLSVGDNWLRNIKNNFEKSLSLNLQFLIAENPSRKLPLCQNALLTILQKDHSSKVDIWNGETAANSSRSCSTARTTTEDKTFIPFILTAEHKKRYEKNLSALESATAHFYCDNDTLLELKNCNPDIVLDNNGNIGLRIGQDDGKWLPIATDDRGGKETIKEFKQVNSHLLTYLILGCGEGKALRSILDLSNISTRWEGFAQVVYLIELYPLLLKTCLCFEDISDALKAKRLRLFLGRNAKELFERYLENDLQLRRPNKVFVSSYCRHGNLFQSIENYLIQSNGQQVQQIALLHEKVQNYYSAIPKEEWVKKFTKHTAIKIMCFPSRKSSFLQYCSRDIVEGFREIGCEAKLVTEKDGMSDLPSLEVLQEIDHFKPDIIFILNRLRSENNFLPESIPYFCWVMDPMDNIFEDNGLKTDDFELVCSISSAWATALRNTKKFKHTQIELLPFAVNETLYKPLDIGKKLYDVGYISHMYHPQQSLLLHFMPDDTISFNQREQQVIAKDPSIESVVVACYRELSNLIEGMGILELNDLLFQEKREIFLTTFFYQQSFDKNSSFFDYLVSFESRFVISVTIMLKYLVIKLLFETGFDVRVWGKNWELYKGLGNSAQGPAKNGAEINKIQNTTSISLNNSPLVSMHMKALEIMASNNFMLTRRNCHDIEPITDYFTENEEVVLFDDETDLVQKVQFYIDNPVKMKTLSQKAYEKVLQKHTYSALAHTIKDRFHSRFATMEMN